MVDMAAKKKPTVGELYRAFKALSPSDQQSFVDVLPPEMLYKNPTVAMLLEVPYPNLSKRLDVARKKRARKGSSPFPTEDEAYAGIAKMMGWTLAETENKLGRRKKPPTP
jgi:hypothetical protein